MSTPEDFTQFALDERILEAIESLGFLQATPIQAQSIPHLLAGHDVIGRARTGSGKTAAFGLSLLHRLRDREPKTRAIVLCPTRELALQVSDAIRSYARKLKGIRIATIYGGAPYPPQIKALRNGAAIVVGTPGRVIDHIKRETLPLEHIESVVLDEADEMLRMGFIDDVRTILDGIPTTRQVMLFSASMPEAIRAVANDYLQNPITVQVERAALTVDHIEQFGIVVPQRKKIEALQRVLAGAVTGPTLVFARTRMGCAETADALAKRGIAVDALHGNLTQAARERVLGRFRARGLEIVIATDVAARGLDVDHITHVINFDLPQDIETYVHRIGRTGRAGRKGTAISFLTPRERRQFRFLQNKLRADIQVMHVPTDDAIARHKQALLTDEVRRSLEEKLVDAEQWVHRLAKETGLPIPKIAAAAAQLLAQMRGTNLAPLGPEPSPEPPRARSTPTKQRPRPNKRRTERKAQTKPPTKRHDKKSHQKASADQTAKKKEPKGAKPRVPQHATGSAKHHNHRPPLEQSEIETKPLISGDAKDKGKGDAKSKGKSDAKSKGKSDAKDKGKGDAKSKGKGDAKSKGKSDAKSKGNRGAKNKRSKKRSGVKRPPPTDKKRRKRKTGKPSP